MRTLTFGTLLLALAGCTDAPGAVGPTSADPSDPGTPRFAADGATYVLGTGNAAVDVPAVQQAVDAGGDVVLRGTFSFEGASFQEPEHGGPFHRYVILVTGSVSIRGDEATIVAGGSVADGLFQAVFLIDDEDADVVFEGIRFESPVNAAIRALESGDLRVADCEIDGVVPTAFPTMDGGTLNGALGIDLRGGPFGMVHMADNRLRIGGTDTNEAGGISVDGTAADVEITGNRIEDTSRHGLNLENIGGPVLAERNVIVTGRHGSGGEPGTFIDALRVVGTGDYTIAHNYLETGNPNAAVLRIAATEGAEVVSNEIVASVAASDTPGVESAGIQVRGSATGNRIDANRIGGRGRVAISVVHSDFQIDRPDGTDGKPRDTAFTGNNVQQFDATVATVEIGTGALNTTITGGSGTIIDDGTGTVVQGDFGPPM